MVRRVNPFWRGSYLGASAGQNMKLNRSFSIVANRWRAQAPRAAAYAGRTAVGAAAGLGLGLVAGYRAYRLAKRVFKTKYRKPDMSKYKQIDFSSSVSDTIGKRKLVGPRPWVRQFRIDNSK